MRFPETRGASPVRWIDPLGCHTSRGVAQPGSALAWGARGRPFKSARPDHGLWRTCVVHAGTREGSWLATAESLNTRR